MSPPGDPDATTHGASPLDDLMIRRDTQVPNFDLDAFNPLVDRCELLFEFSLLFVQFLEFRFQFFNLFCVHVCPFYVH